MPTLNGQYLAYEAGVERFDTSSGCQTGNSMLYSNYIKALDVVLSCKTIAQLAVATRYLTLLYKREDSIEAITMLNTQVKVKQYKLMESSDG